MALERIAIKGSVAPPKGMTQVEVKENFQTIRSITNEEAGYAWGITLPKEEVQDAADRKKWESAVQQKC